MSEKRGNCTVFILFDPVLKGITTQCLIRNIVASQSPCKMSFANPVRLWVWAVGLAPSPGQVSQALLELETLLENTEKESAEGRTAVNLTVFYRTLLENENFFERSSCFCGLSSISSFPPYHQNKWEVIKTSVWQKGLIWTAVRFHIGPSNTLLIFRDSFKDPPILWPLKKNFLYLFPMEKVPHRKAAVFSRPLLMHSSGQTKLIWKGGREGVLYFKGFSIFFISFFPFYCSVWFLCSL